MKNIKAWQVVVPLMVIGLAGCDFSKPGDGEYWSDSYNWVNFSGTYKSPAGGAVVQLPSTSAAGTNVVTENVEAEVGTLTSSQFYTGNLGHQSIVPGSLQISSVEWTFNDNGLGNLVTTSGSFAGSPGLIHYASGAWSLDLNAGAALINQGMPITARYQFTVSSTTGGGNSDVVKIYTLTVMQEGNLINMTDSNGSQCSGKLGSLSGSNGSATLPPLNGDQVIAQFKMSGRDNLTGRDVEIVGTLQGSVVRSGAAYYLANRTIVGTWMESDGVTLDITGVASQVSINVSTNGLSKAGN